MTVLSPPLERNLIALSSLQGILIALAMLVILATWLFAGYQLSQAREQVLDSQATTLRNLAQVVAENINQVLDRTPALEILTRQQLLEGRETGEDSLATLVASDPAFKRIMLYTRSGLELASTSPGTLPQLREDWRESLEYQQSWPVQVLPIEHSGEFWSVPLVIPVSVAQQPEGCLLVLDMDLGYLLNLYQKLELGRETSIHVLTAQGEELLRAERGGLVTGPSAFDNQVMLSSRLPQGSTRDRHAQDRQQYLGYFLKLEMAPLIVTVRQSEPEALAAYYRQRDTYLYSVVVMTLIAIGGLLWLLWMMHVREAQMQALQLSEQRNQKLLNRLRREHQNTLKAASRDHLTGLYNRRLFVELAHSHLLGSKRQGRFAAVCFIDLDRFKAINDTLGHKVGDNLLQEVARRLTDNLRESDIISRFGGDEFVVMLTAVKQQEDVEHKAQHLVNVLAAPYPELEAAGLGTSPSIGVAISPRDGLDIETLIKHADMAMYRAKHAGRGQYRLFDSQQADVVVSDEELCQRLPQALRQGEFKVHYQPRLRLRGYETAGFEALLRWDSPVCGLLLPDTFLPLVEQQGLMSELGYQVFQQVTRQLAAWRALGLNPLPISVNLHRSQLTDPAFAGQIRQLLEQHQLDVGWLELEIADQDLPYLGEMALEQLRCIQQLGVELVMDDFGSSEEGLERASRLPFGSIKLSRTLIQHIRNSYDDNVLLSATISVAKKLKRRVVAKGVETPDQLVYLKLAGCDEAQGFLFSRALNTDETEDYLMHPNREVLL